MKIQFLGTAAFEGIPSLFCNCRVCRESMRAGGRNIRSRSQALVDNKLLLDFNADTCAHYLKYPFDWDEIQACLITHSHSDHLYVEDMIINTPGYADAHATWTFYAAEDGYNKIQAITERTKNHIAAKKVEPGVEFTVGDYRILPLWADHDPLTSPVFYAITNQAEGKRMLYAHDTGIFPDKTWERLKSETQPFDLISLDCTGCVLTGWVHGHMGLDGDQIVTNRLREMGLVTDKTIVVVNHFSHNAHATHDELVAVAEPQGMVVSYDGMEVEF